MHWINPNSLMPVTGAVERFLFNLRGEADGMILKDGRLAHFPPHMSKDVLAQIEPGDRVTLYGVKPRAVDLIACVAIDTAAGLRIEDSGPPEHDKGKGGEDRTMKPKSAPLEVSGTVERPLYGPKGEIRGVLLEEGEIVRFQKYASGALADLLVAGAKLAARGEGIKTSQATVVEAKELGRSSRSLKRLPGKPHKKD